MRSCCACCTRLPARRCRASRSPSPLRRARRLAAALQTSGRFGTRGFQRFGLPCLALATKLGCRLAATKRCAASARAAARTPDAFVQRRSGELLAGSKQSAEAAGRSMDASLLLPRGTAQKRRRSRSAGASHPAAISPVSHHTELSRH